MTGESAILLAVYGGDRPGPLERALVSLREQTGVAPARLLVGVDGPIDGQLQGVLNRHQQDIAHLRQCPRRQGLGPTLNGLLPLLGDAQWVFRMDADDISLPQRFCRQLEFMRAHPEVDILGTALEGIDAHSGTPLFVRRYPRTHQDIVARLGRGTPLAHGTVCFRRRALERLGGYPEDAPLMEDLALWQRALDAHMVLANLPDVLYLQRLDPAFVARRSAASAGRECRLHLEMVLAHHGVSTRLVFPLLRWGFRHLPHGLGRRLYTSPLRSWLLNAPGES
ncbi:MAG: glycosyltransferase [Magnetococcus sp. WYHC-3]